MDACYKKIRTLCVDDFFIKYVDKEDTKHLLQALNELYTISIDWKASLYCSVKFDWNYDQKAYDLSVPGYVDAAF